MTTRLSAEDVTLSYGREAVVRELSVHIADGRITTIIGPNGCGKSTLLRALGRLMKAKGGSVLLDGEQIQHQSTKSVARRLGLLPQGSLVPDAITVEDLVSRGRYPHQTFFQPPTEKDHLAVERALELAGVTELRKRPIDELSGGQRQRAWIAMTLAQDTAILLLDEPTTYLDIAHQREILSLIQRLNSEERKTVVMVLHDIGEAARVSDQVVVMERGKVVASGAPPEVLTPGLLCEVFGVQTAEVRHPRSGRSVCVPFQSTAPPQRTASTGTALRADSLRLGYGQREVARDLSVGFPEGRVTAIIGPNACGKTTLLRAAARLLKPASGEVFMGDRPVRAGSRRRLARELAFLTQSPITPPDLTVGELVASGRFPHQRWWKQWSRDDANAVETALFATGTNELRDTEVRTLSGGQRQRAWLAMTLAQDTPLLILDEPTTFLDIAHQLDVLELVRRMNREDGRTVIMVLHDLHHAFQYADHVVAMRDGSVLAAGPPTEIATAGLVREVFGIEVDVISHPIDGTPLVFVAEQTCDQPDENGRSAHDEALETGPLVSAQAR